MSKPRQILPESEYLISRRTIEGRFLLTPVAEITQLVLYCLAYAAKQHGIDLHAFTVLSNHYHLVLTDHLCTLPAFMQTFNQLIARAANKHHDRAESFWSPGSYSAVRCEQPEDTLDKIVYTLANPVAAELVSHSTKWTGASSRKMRFGDTITCKRPKAFFRRQAEMPASVTLTLVRPPGFEHLDDEQLQAELRRRLNARESEIRARVRAEGRSFMGMEAVLAQNPEDKPKRPAPRGNLNPRIAAKDKDVRIAALEREKQFQRAYREAYARYRNGAKNVWFPAGTYAMRVRLRAKCYETDLRPQPLC